METVEQMSIALRRFNCNRQRFTPRQRFFSRCLEDISEDFHKQYGAFYRDWEMTAEACSQYITATDDYLRSRDLIAIEFELLLGAIDTSETKYARVKAIKKFTDLMTVCESNDRVTLQEIDEDVANVRLVYSMIAEAECEPEE